MATPASPPKIVSARRVPAPPRQPGGAFHSGKTADQRSGARRRRPLGPIPPPEDEQSRLTAAMDHRNPLLEASRVLLRALTDMPALIGIGHHERLRGLLMDEVRVFERLCVRANVRIEHVIGARYCLCTALDEAAMRALAARGDASGGAAWAADALTSRIGEDNQGGSKVYALSLRLLKEEGDHWPLLEVIHRIFSLGFEGRYRQGMVRGVHERMRERLYDAIAPYLPPVPDALSPHAQSTATVERAPYFEIPVWTSVVLLSIALCGLYVYCSANLSARADKVRHQFAAIARVTTGDVGDAQDTNRAR